MKDKQYAFYTRKKGEMLVTGVALGLACLIRIHRKRLKGLMRKGENLRAL